MATQHDLADAFQLRSTTGWQTLMAILQSTGERIPKRSRQTDVLAADPAASSYPGRRGIDDSDERLAKRFASVRLNARGDGRNGRDRPSAHET